MTLPGPSSTYPSKVRNPLKLSAAIPTPNPIHRGQYSSSLFNWLLNVLNDYAIRMPRDSRIGGIGMNGGVCACHSSQNAFSISCTVIGGPDQRGQQQDQQKKRQSRSAGAPPHPNLPSFQVSYWFTARRRSYIFQWILHVGTYSVSCCSTNVKSKSFIYNMI